MRKILITLFSLIPLVAFAASDNPTVVLKDRTNTTAEQPTKARQGSQVTTTKHRSTVVVNPQPSPHRNVTVVDKHPTPAMPTHRRAVKVVKPAVHPGPKERAQYQVIRPSNMPLIAGQWTCSSYDASGERWYAINDHRKHALKKAHKSCKRNSHIPHSCHGDSAFCVFGGQKHVQNNVLLR